jgi:DNA-binding beta-propeller fold protein YncE
VAVNSKDYIIVAETGYNRIQIFDRRGTFIHSFGELLYCLFLPFLGSFGALDGQFHLPYGLAVNKLDQIIISDTQNNRVQIFDQEGKFMSQFGIKGNAPSCMNTPRGVAVLPTGKY